MVKVPSIGVWAGEKAGSRVAVPPLRVIAATKHTATPASRMMAEPICTRWDRLRRRQISAASAIAPTASMISPM